MIMNVIIKIIVFHIQPRPQSYHENKMTLKGAVCVSPSLITCNTPEHNRTQEGGHLKHWVNGSCLGTPKTHIHMHTNICTHTNTETEIEREKSLWSWWHGSVLVGETKLKWSESRGLSHEYRVTLCWSVQTFRGKPPLHIFRLCTHRQITIKGRY